MQPERRELAAGAANQGTASPDLPGTDLRKNRKPIPVNRGTVPLICGRILPFLSPESLVL